MTATPLQPERKQQVIRMIARLAGAGVKTAGWDNARHGLPQASPTVSDRLAALLGRRPRAADGTVAFVTDDDYWAAFPDLLTSTDLARILRVGRTAVLARLKRGTIPGHQISGSWIIFKAEIRAWLASTSNQAPATPPAPVDVLASYPEEMTYRDLMVLFGKSKPTIYGWLRTGVIPASHAANRWIIFKAQLRPLLEKTSNQVRDDD
jgi:predicted DNA-binding transcriptional regulator AlpA